MILMTTYQLITEKIIYNKRYHMKYLHTYKLFESVKDDNLLMEITHVLSQRLLEQIALATFQHHEERATSKRVPFYNLYMRLNNSINSHYLSKMGAANSVTEYGSPKKDVIAFQKRIKKYYPNYKPKYNKMSKKAFEMFQEMLSYLNTKIDSETRRNFKFFVIDFVQRTNSSFAQYQFESSKISLYVSQVQFLEYVNRFDDDKDLKFLNDGLMISNHMKSSLFHEMRHFYDDYQSKGKYVPKIVLAPSRGDSKADYISQDMEVSAWVSQFIQEVKLGYNYEANQLNVTMDSTWKELKKVVYLHFDNFKGYKKSARETILSKISKEWIVHNQKNKK